MANSREDSRVDSRMNLKKNLKMSCKIGNVEINPCIMNASGPRCITEDELNEIANSESGAIVTKTMTLESRKGNPEPRYFADDLGSINSSGLPNLGYKEYSRIISKLKSKMAKNKISKSKLSKPIIASISGMKYEDFSIICKELSKVADIIEVNLSCPNLVGKPQIAYDFETSEKLLEELRSIIKVPMTVKLPPYLDTAYRKQMADILLKSKVDGITLINSIGHTLIIDPDKEETVIKPNNGLGGLGGKYIKPVALGNIWGFYSFIGKKIPIIGVGGIYSGKDAYEHILAGASAVQIATAYQEEGTEVFSRVKQELEQILRDKNVRDIKDKIGKLKILN